MGSDPRKAEWVRCQLHRMPPHTLSESQRLQGLSCNVLVCDASTPAMDWWTRVAPA